MTHPDKTDVDALVERLNGFTPGPWTFEMEQDEWPDHALISRDGDPVLRFDFDLGFRMTPCDAALIAAAPDLHTALTAALDEIERLRADAPVLFGYQRVIEVFDKNATAASFLREDGEGGLASGVHRMAAEIGRLRAALEATR